MSLFNRHDFINPYRVGINVVKQGIFHRYVHTPTGFAGMEFLDIPRCIRMVRQPFDMFADHPAIFFREFPDELFYTIFDVDPHINSVSEPEFFLGLIPRDEVTVLINLVEVPFQRPLLMFGDEISHGIAKGLSRGFYIRESCPCTGVSATLLFAISTCSPFASAMSSPLKFLYNLHNSTNLYSCIIIDSN